MFNNCPLCRSASAIILAQINARDIVTGYQKFLGFDISSELPEQSIVDLKQCQACNLIYFFPTYTGSESFYDTLGKFDWYYQTEKDEFDHAIGFLPNDGKVLEIGAGSGDFAQKLEGIDYLGLELNQSAIEVARNRGFQVINQTIEQHASNHKEEYDVVCAFQTLEHVENPHAFIKSSLMCLKPGGLFIASVPNHDSFISTVTNNVLNIPPHHITWWSSACLTKLPDFYRIELVEISQGDLDPIHHRWFATNLIIESLRKYFNRPYKLLDFSIQYWIIRKVSALGSRLLQYGLNNKAYRPFGHSITAVYKKL